MKQKLANFDFVKNFKYTFSISAVFMAIAIVGLLLSAFGVPSFNMDIDFVGGTTMQFELHTAVDSTVTGEVADIVKEVTGKSASSVTKGGDGGTQVVIKTLELSSEVRDEVFAAVCEKYDIPEGEMPIKSDFVSASVGKDLQQSAISASILAVVLILVYITFRFQFRSGVAAVGALVHDLLVMLSMYIIFRIPLNMNFIAAALTILGYSINATIVAFDRIRENQKLQPKGKFSDLVNLSIVQTMSRSINTTLTTLFSIVMLLIFGVPSIQNFALPVCIGVLCGCYSSVCISGPLWNIMESKRVAKAARYKK